MLRHEEVEAIAVEHGGRKTAVPLLSHSDAFELACERALPDATVACDEAMANVPVPRPCEELDRILELLRDRVLVEDLAVTMLINSRVEARQATGVFRNGATLDLRALPEKPLGETTDVERQLIAEVVGTMTSWPGVVVGSR